MTEETRMEVVNALLAERTPEEIVEALEEVALEEVNEIKSSLPVKEETDQETTAEEGENK